MIACGSRASGKLYMQVLTMLQKEILKGVTHLKLEVNIVPEKDELDKLKEENIRLKKKLELTENQICGMCGQLGSGKCYVCELNKSDNEPCNEINKSE